MFVYESIVAALALDKQFARFADLTTRLLDAFVKFVAMTGSITWDLRATSTRPKRID